MATRKRLNEQIQDMQALLMTDLWRWFPPR
jgi:hypothetical protein